MNGKLQFYNKRQKTPGKDPNQTPKERQIASPSYQDPSLNQQVEQKPESAVSNQSPVEQQPVDPAVDPAAQETPPANYLPVEKTKGSLIITFGRFNPPTA